MHGQASWTDRTGLGCERALGRTCFPENKQLQARLPPAPSGVCSEWIQYSYHSWNLACLEINKLASRCLGLSFLRRHSS